MYHIHSSTKAIKIGKSLRETLKDLYFILTLTELQISFTVLQVPTKIPDGHNNLYIYKLSYQYQEYTNNNVH